ncbi:MAG: DUF371 domain-containing protein [Crenarchaeota archaeon]|nr:DUF371 domain-containing protein [Thermoproteota archaeon]
MKIVCDKVTARGHGMISARHRNTIEITKDEYVTERGTCIIACSADKALKDLKDDLKRVLKNNNTVVVIKVKCVDKVEMILCRGSDRLILTNDRKIVVRKSKYIDDATLCIESNKGASDLDRVLISRICMGDIVEILICAIELENIT